jgi:hypothetical protein
MSERLELGYRYDSRCRIDPDDDVLDYSNGKIYEIYSDECDYKYLGGSVNSLECILNNWDCNLRRYDDGSYDKYFEVYEILRYGSAGIRLLKDFPCSKKSELDKEVSNILRANRLDYININLYAREIGMMRIDVASGLELCYIEKYKSFLRCVKFEKYVEMVNRIIRSQKDCSIKFKK